MNAGTAIAFLYFAAGLGSALGGEAPSGITLASAEETFLPVEGGRLRCRSAGRGPVLILVHDGLVASESWAPLFPALSVDFRVVAYDRRGAGKSDPPPEKYSDVADLDAVVKSCGAPTVAIAGCSYGGQVTLEYAADHPDRINALVLVGPVVSGFPPSGHFLQRNLENFAPAIRSGDVAATIERWVNDPYLVAPGNAAARARLGELLRADPWAFRAGRNSTPTAPALPRLGGVPAPTLIVVGALDIPDVHAHVGAIQAALPDARRRVLAGAGHLVHLEQPEELVKAMLDFLAPTGRVERHLASARSDALYQEGLKSLGYEPGTDLAFQVHGTEQKGGAEVVDASYPSSDGGRVTAYVVRPAGGRRPAAGALFLHPGNGSRSTFLPDALALAGDGVVSLLIDAQFARPQPWRRPQAGFDGPKSAAETADLVKDLRRGLDLLVKSERVDPSRLAYVGHSLGATAGAVLLGVEPRIRAAVMMAGVLSLVDFMAEGEGRVSAAFQTLPTADERRTFAANMRPLEGLQFIHRRPPDQSLLLQFARRDEFITRWEAAVYEAAGKPTRVEWYLSDHDLNEEARQSRLKWLRERLLSSARAPAAEASGIWGRTIAKQPFDEAPFREVRIPEWVEGTTGVGYTLSVQGPEERKKAIEAGVTISEMGFVDPLYVYYDSRLLSRRSPHVPADRTEKEVAEYRRLGLRILAVYPPSLQGEVYENHPEWRRIPENTDRIPQVDLKVHPYGGMLCLLGPYGDFFIEVLAEILTRYQVDAFSFDGLHYGGVCYCRSCRDGYRAEAGAEIPGVDMDDPAFRRYQHWADRRMERTVRRMQERLKGIKPDVALITWTTNAGRFGHFRDIPRNMPARMNLLLDAPDQELWLDETNRGSTVLPALGCAYVWAVTNHRVAFSEPYLMSHGNPYGKDSFPAPEVVRRMLLPLAYGVSPSIALAQPPNMRPAVFEGLREVARRKPWLTHKTPEPWAAILLSDNSRVFYGRHPSFVEERYLASVAGVFRAAVEEHLPVTVINDWNLNPADLAPYRVLVLPNAACLDDAQLNAVKGFVAAGGGLVASLETSLFDELGNPRPDFALGEVLGVSYRRPAAGQAPAGEGLDVNFAKGLDAAYWEKRKGIFDFRCAADSIFDRDRMRAYIGADAVTYKGPAVEVDLRGDGAEAAATIEGRGGGAPRRPAAVVRSSGKGRAVYFASGLDAAYYLYPYPYQRLALARAIRWAAGDPPPVEVLAPMCVHASVLRQKRDGERLVIHLFNDINTTAFHALPSDDVPLREESLPVHDIRVRLKSSYPIARMHLEPDGTPLESRQVDGWIEVTVPRLDIHAMVVAELRA